VTALEGQGRGRQQSDHSSKKGKKKKKKKKKGGWMSISRGREDGETAACLRPTRLKTNYDSSDTLNRGGPVGRGGSLEGRAHFRRDSPLMTVGCGQGGNSS